MKVIPIAPGLILEIDLAADSEPLFCLRALDADNQKVFFYRNDVEVLIKALGDALAVVDVTADPPPDAASVKARWSG